MGKVLLFTVLLLPIAWHIGRREWDYRAAYAGVVVEKGMDYSLIFRSRYSGADLYVVIKDDAGNRSKRFVGTTRSWTDISTWQKIQVGSSVVKNKGYGEVPRVLGEPIQSVANPNSHLDGGFVVILLLCGGAIFV